MKKFGIFFSSGLILGCFFSFTPQATATQINTSEKDSAYHTKFCPPLKKALKRAQFDYKCSPTNGSIDNIKMVGEDARQLGFAQLDLFSLEKTMLGGKKLFHTLRDDIAKVCLFLVSKNKDFKNYGQVAANAANLHFILPPEKTNHVGTFQFLQQIDPQGLGTATSIVYAENTDDAVNQVLDSNDPSFVTMFVQFPDPDNKQFKAISDKGGRFIPVIDRNILRQDINGEKVYYAEDTQIANPKWDKKGARVITSCTPIVLFTGTSKLIRDATAQKDHDDLIKTIEALPVTDLQPKQSLLSQLWKKTKSLSATSVEALVKASDKARKAAKPMVNKAKELGTQALEASKPLIEKAKEVGAQALEKAKELTDKTIEGENEVTEKPAE